MSHKLAQYNEYNPFRRPDWRYERVLGMLDSPDRVGRSTKSDDEWTKGFRGFIPRYLRYPERHDAMFRQNPGLFLAYKINENRNDDPEIAFTVEARLLANQTDQEIAGELDTLPQAITWYEKLFFDVRKHLHAHDWIIKHGLMPAILEALAGPTRPSTDGDDVPDTSLAAAIRRTPLAEPFWDSTLKFFGYFGGPILLDFMISSFRRGIKVHSQEDISGWMDQATTHSLKRRSVMAACMFEVNKFNVMELFATHARLMEIERSTDSDDHARTEIEKNVSGLLQALPWSVGRSSVAHYEGTDVIEADQGAAELRDGELMQAASGQSIDTMKQITSQEFPPVPEHAKKADGQEDQSNADPQQGS